MSKNFFAVLAAFTAITIGASAVTFNLKNPRDIKNWESFAIVGDAGMKNSTTQSLRQTLAANKMFNLIMPGDNLYIPTTTYASVWDIWKKEGFQFPIVAIGNHNSGYDKEVAYFQMPGEYYAKESKGALFIVLNSDNKINYNEQLAWMDLTLSKSQYPLNFIIYHHPTITVSGAHDWEERKGFQTGMRALIKKHAQKITSLIVGHDHSAGLYTINDTPMILSGASWESRKIKLPVAKDPQVNAIGYWATVNGGFWWTKLDYNALTKEVYVHYIRFDKQQEVCTFRISPKPIAKTNGCNL
ncbi:MAG: hypothetical protein JNL11_14295 [Bdellovibrionaceae bacterium]|nr:hypothetical protein [Pseudobdellovibrionaceae bacterium]